MVELEEVANQSPSTRMKLARGYVRWLRRRNPEATPAEIVASLEKHYLSSVMAAGAVVSAGAVAATVGVAMMPLPGSSKAASAGARAGTSATKAALRRASKILALRGVRTGAQKAALMLPAGDQQLQFELTALFGLALAEIHGMSLDKDQADVLVYGLSNRRLSQGQIAQLAVELARAGSGVVLEPAPPDPGEWTRVLAGALPGGAAQQLLMSIQSEDIYPVADKLSDRQQAGVEYGIAAVAGGASKFAFGKDVVEASRHAFPPPPLEFTEVVGDNDQDLLGAEEDATSKESWRALRTLKESATSAGGWVKRSAKTGVQVAGSVGRSVAGVVRRGKPT